MDEPGGFVDVGGERAVEDGEVSEMGIWGNGTEIEVAGAIKESG